MALNVLVPNPLLRSSQQHQQTVMCPKAQAHQLKTFHASVNMHTTSTVHNKMCTRTHAHADTDTHTPHTQTYRCSNETFLVIHDEVDILLEAD